MTLPSASAPNTRPRIAIVGCGLVGELHRDRLRSEPIDIVAVCDPDADALARMAGSLRPRPRLFRSEQDLLAAGICDAVVLCTPHSRHADQIRRALDAGVHVLCEKPFVTQYEDGAELVLRAREKNLALFVSYTRRSRGHARFLQRAAGQIGPLTHVIITRAQPWLPSHGRTWRLRRDEGGGFLLDAGASMLDLLLHLVDSPVDEVNAELSRLGNADVDVDVRSSIRLKFVNGVRADVLLIGDATEQVERIQLFGVNGTAGWMLREDAPHELYVRPAGGPSEDGDPALYRTLSPDAAFVAALRSGRSFGPDTAPDLYDAATAVPVIALVERIFQSASWR
jgi:predicted dehydrogenase